MTEHRVYCVSRYGQPRYVAQHGPHEFSMYGDSRYCRGGEGFFDFEGGPFIAVGDTFMDDRVITRIEPRENGQLWIYTKENENG